MTDMEFPRTLLEFEERFATENACREFLAKLRWPDGFRCSACGDSGWLLRSRPLMECRGCGKQQSITAGTIFHRTRKPLKLWFRALFLVSSQKIGTNALTVFRQLGLGSYSTAWTWLHKIRRAMIRPGRDSLHGLVEIDEAYVGGQETGTDGRETRTKVPVVVAVELDDSRSGRIRIESIRRCSTGEIGAFVHRNVAAGSAIRTDGHHAYRAVAELGFGHVRIPIGMEPKHATRYFPHVHRVIALLKRWLLGTFQGAVRPKHLQSYLDEFVFRFNRRNAKSVGLAFGRLCGFAVSVAPTTHRRIVQCGST